MRQKGGLAFPVSTEQADTLFFVDGDAGVVEQKRSAEGYGQVAVTDQGHALKNKIKEGSDNPTRSGGKTEVVLDLRQSPGVQNVGGGQPTLAGGMNPGKLVVELMKGMGIRVDATKQALLGRPSPVSPVHVEAHGVGVKLENLAVGDSRVDDLGGVHPAGFAPEQEPGAQVSEHRNLGMLEGGDDPGGHGLLVLGQSVMNGSHDVIEGVEYGILEVEFSAGENVHLRTGEGVTAVFAALIELADSRHLLGQAFFVQAVGLKTGFGMIGDAQVFPTPGIRFGGHFIEGIPSVRGGGMVVKAALEVGIFE